MLIATYYLLSENLGIFATRLCKLLIINTGYFRGGKITNLFHKKEVQTKICTSFSILYILCSRTVNITFCVAKIHFSFDFSK